MSKAPAPWHRKAHPSRFRSKWRQGHSERCEVPEPAMSLLRVLYHMIWHRIRCSCPDAVNSLHECQPDVKYRTWQFCARCPEWCSAPLHRRCKESPIRRTAPCWRTAWMHYGYRPDPDNSRDVRGLYSLPPRWPVSTWEMFCHIHPPREQENDFCRSLRRRQSLLPVLRRLS